MCCVKIDKNLWFVFPLVKSLNFFLWYSRKSSWTRKDTYSFGQQDNCTYDIGPLKLLMKHYQLVLYILLQKWEFLPIKPQLCSFPIQMSRRLLVCHAMLHSFSKGRLLDYKNGLTRDDDEFISKGITENLV